MKLEDFKTSEKGGGEGTLIPSKMKLKSKLNILFNKRRCEMAYLDKERAETARRHREYLEWLKAQEPIRRKYAQETERRMKEYLARHRAFEKTLGK